MGILNVTPDSFSDGGNYLSVADGVRRAKELEAGGAMVIDVGGESTRPGADPVNLEEELRRVIPVIQGIRAGSDIVISVDTCKAEVAREALRAGADIVNDITALRGDPDMADVVTRAGAGVVLMHMKGTPATMQDNPIYEQAGEEVREFLRQRMKFSINFGMLPQAIVLDPGIGFGKTPGHNRQILRATPLLAALGRPILLGVSRKSFLGWLADAPAISDRHWPGVTLTSLGREWGARIFRVHDPAPHSQALRMTEAILHGMPHA
ncbi:MAG: dihydropteroate synthase [Terrimicrobiaceae bacterium]